MGDLLGGGTQRCLRRLKPVRQRWRVQPPGDRPRHWSSHPSRRKGILYNVEIRASARKHGIEDADILHAWANQLRYVPSRSGALLELVVPTDQPPRIIHADKLRAKFYKYLQ